MSNQAGAMTSHDRAVSLVLRLVPDMAAQWQAEKVLHSTFKPAFP
jgi:hypothetical protein